MTHRRENTLRWVFGAGLALLTLGLAEPAVAQDCGNWYRPILCEAQLIATDADRQSVQLDDRSGIRMAPRESFDFEIVGRDQRGRRFPSDRLVLGYDANTCRSMLQMERQFDGALRVSAQRAEGRCELYLWVPGNLNFEWAVEIEITPAARVDYRRREAEFIVERLYRAILGREAEDAGFQGGVSEVEAGRLESLVTSMLRSAEFRQNDVRSDPSALLEQFYQGIFGRPADDGGRRLYFSDVRAGRHAEVLLKLIRSAEFERLLPR